MVFCLISIPKLDTTSVAIPVSYFPVSINPQDSLKHLKSTTSGEDVDFMHIWKTLPMISFKLWRLHASNRSSLPNLCSKMTKAPVIWHISALVVSKHIARVILALPPVLPERQHQLELLLFQMEVRQQWAVPKDSQPSLFLSNQDGVCHVYQWTTRVTDFWNSAFMLADL